MSEYWQGFLVAALPGLSIAFLAYQLGVRSGLKWCERHIIGDGAQRNE